MDTMYPIGPVEFYCANEAALKNTKECSKTSRAVYYDNGWTGFGGWRDQLDPYKSRTTIGLEQSRHVMLQLSAKSIHFNISFIYLSSGAWIDSIRVHFASVGGRKTLPTMTMGLKTEPITQTVDTRDGKDPIVKLEMWLDR